MGLATAGCNTKPNPVWQVGGASGADASTSSTSASSAGTSGDTTTGATSASGAAVTSSDSSGSSQTSAGTGSEASSSGGTGDRLPDLCPGGSLVVHETFDGAPDGTAWIESIDTNTTASIEDGVLRVAVQNPDPGDFEYWRLLSTDVVPEVGMFGLEVRAVPPNGVNAQLYVGLLAPDDELVYFNFEGLETEVLLRSDVPDWTTVGTMPFDANAHRWVRIRYDLSSPTVEFETSVDGEQWTPFTQADVVANGNDMTDSVLEVSIGSWLGPASGEMGAVDNVFLCSMR